MVFTVFISIALFVLYFSISFLSSVLWLRKEDTIAVCYCVLAKTPAMGVPLSNVMFVGLTPPMVQSKIQIPMVIYQGLQPVAGSLLTMAFRKWRGNDTTEEASYIERKNIGVGDWRENDDTTEL